MFLVFNDTFLCVLSYCDQFNVLFIFIDFTWNFKFSHMTLMVVSCGLADWCWRFGATAASSWYSVCEDSEYLRAAVECLQGCATLGSEGA